MTRLDEIEARIVETACHSPKLARGQVWCRTCGRTEHVDSAKCLREGWPKCCGHTMTIDAPWEEP
jgi:Zn finger protein HypA/HybF involved in hydrogenase expression